MAKEKQLHLMTPLDVANVRKEGLPIWITAVAAMAVDRVDMSELKLKVSDSPGKMLAERYPLFYTSLVNTIAAHLLVSVAKEKQAEFILSHPELYEPK